MISFVLRLQKLWAFEKRWRPSAEGNEAGRHREAPTEGSQKSRNGRSRRQRREDNFGIPLDALDETPPVGNEAAKARHERRGGAYRVSGILKHGAQMQVGPAVGEGGAGDNRKRRLVFKRQAMARSGSPYERKTWRKERRTVPCGAELPKSDGRNGPQRIRAEARETGSRGQGRRSPSTAQESESAATVEERKRIHGRCSLAVRHAALGASRRGGVAGNSPLEWGAGDAAAPALGRVRRRHCCRLLPSEPDWRVSPHPAQAIGKPRREGEAGQFDCFTVASDRWMPNHLKNALSSK